MKISQYVCHYEENMEVKRNYYRSYSCIYRVLNIVGKNENFKAKSVEECRGRNDWQKWENVI